MSISQQEGGQEAVEKVLKQAEIFRLARSLKMKLAEASLKTGLSPGKNRAGETRRRAKTLDGASQAPRALISFDLSDSTIRKPATTRNSPVKPFPRSSSMQRIEETHYSPRQPIRQRRRSQLPNHDVPLLRTGDALPAEPKTPPTRSRAPPKTPEQSSADGASLLLHFAHSPGRQTPRTPDFNMNDYLHLNTPSPQGLQQTPRQIASRSLQFSSLNTTLFPPE